MFKDRVIAITGAASGIGAAVVRKVTASGSPVLALDIDKTAGSELAAETGAAFRQCDVSSYEDWQSLASFLTSSDNTDGVPMRIHPKSKRDRR